MNNKNAVKSGFKTKVAAGIVFAGLATTPAIAEENDLQTYDAETVTSAHVEQLQQTFGNAAHHPIIILDRPWFDVNAALQNTTIEPHLRDDTVSTLMQHYVSENLDNGEQVPLGIASLFFRDLTLDYEQALPHNYAGSKYWMSSDQTGSYCLLYPSVPNLDNSYQTQTLMFYRPEVYGSLYGHEIQPRLSLEEQTRLTDYHELAHCLDDNYMMDYQNGNLPGGTNAFLTNRHLIELKGELMGVLLMTKFEDATDLAQRRSTIRYLDSWFRGRILNFGAFDEFTAYSGATYAFGPALEALQTEIDTRGTDAIKQMSIDELATLAEQIAEQAQLSTEEKRALVAAYKAPETTAQQNAFIDGYLDKVTEAFVTVTNGAVDADTVRQTIYNEQPQPINDHYQYVPFDNEDAAAKTQRMESVRTALIEKAGDSPALADLVAAHGELYNGYLHIIGHGDAAERMEAMLDIRVLQEALRSAVHDIPEHAAIAPPPMVLTQ